MAAVQRGGNFPQQGQRQPSQAPQDGSVPAGADPTLKIAAISPGQVQGADQRRTKSGRFTMSQLRQTDGIVPLQYGTNQFDSQKKMTSFGTPRDVKGKHLKRIWELEFPDEEVGSQPINQQNGAQYQQGQYQQGNAPQQGQYQQTGQQQFQQQSRPQGQQGGQPQQQFQQQGGQFNQQQRPQGQQQFQQAPQQGFQQQGFQQKPAQGFQGQPQGFNQQGFNQQGFQGQPAQVFNQQGQQQRAPQQQFQGQGQPQYQGQPLQSPPAFR